MKIIYAGTTRKAKSIIVRYPIASDAKAMCEYINALSQEQTFIRFQGEEITLQDEIKYLNSQLERIQRHQEVLLLVLSGDEVLALQV